MKELNIEYLLEKLYLERFKDVDSLLNRIENIISIDLNLDIETLHGEFKTYYEDTNNQDWEYILTLELKNGQAFDITLYYTLTRKGEMLIVETAFEEV